MYARLLTACLTACLLPFAACADELTDRIDSGRKHYEAGRVGSAVNDLQSVLVRLRAKLEEQITQAMPPAPESWRLDANFRQNIGYRVAAAGTNLNFIYTQSGIAPGINRIAVIVALDNPAVWSGGGVHLGLLNPSYAEQLGYTTVPVDGLPGGALYKWAAATATGEGYIIIPGRLLIRAHANGAASGEALKAILSRWDVKKLKAIADIQ